MNQTRNNHRLSGIQRLQEVALIASIFCSLLLFIALATYHPADPGWSQTALHDEIYNAIGRTGAWTADLLLFLFGWIAFAIPFCLALLGWGLFRRRHDVTQQAYFALGLRVLGGVLLLCSCAGIAALNIDDLYFHSSGGMLGNVISGLLMPAFNFAGSVLVLLALFAMGFTLFSGLSLLFITEKTGQGVCWLFERGWQLPAQWLDERKQLAADSDSGFEVTFETELGPDEDDLDEPEPIVEQAKKPNRTSQLLKDILKLDAKPDTLDERAEPEWVEPELGEQELELPFDMESIEEASSQSNVTPLKPKKVAKKAVPVVINKVTQADKPQGSLPDLSLLDKPDKKTNPVSKAELDAVSKLVEAKLLDFGIQAEVVDVFPGPVITRFELDLAPGVKVAKITALSKDLARSLSALSVRVVEVIPGKTYIGLEIPNKHREMVRLSEVITDTKFVTNASPLTMVLGADIAGKPVIVDLAKMPHLLVAGTTGSGKSVGVNVMILSLLYKSTPEDVRLIMIDPKMLELSVYEGIPHLLAEVVTDMKEAANALRWCVGEMERRYKLMSVMGVRNLQGFNRKVQEAKAAGEPLYDPLWKPSDGMEEMPPELETLPRIVVVVDEFADMMMIVGKKVEELIARIAQKARAAGIHLILATQRPSVDVITGLIKANIPTRIAFQVSSRVDSRTILDQQGAENLLGQGDMLYLPPGSGVPTRVHGAFVDDHEVHNVVSDWKSRGEPNYIEAILSGEGDEVLLPGERPETSEDDYDPLYDEAVAFVCESRRGSISSVQRKLKIGYNRAARIIEQMEIDGVVSPAGHNGNREVLAPPPPK